MRQAREDRDGRVGGATMLQPLMLRLTCKAAAFAAAKPTLLFKFYSCTKKQNEPSFFTPLFFSLPGGRKNYEYLHHDDEDTMITSYVGAKPVLRVVAGTP